MFSDREDGRFSLGTRMSVMARVSMGVRAFIGAATLRNNKKNSARFTGGRCVASLAHT